MSFAVPFRKQVFRYGLLAAMVIEISVSDDITALVVYNRLSKICSRYRPLCLLTIDQKSIALGPVELFKRYTIRMALIVDPLLRRILDADRC